jgi:UDP-N-acetylmuramate: L-alanyl-gamma-D-glutamyl-meso-diaminopimelate ligase
LVISYNYKLSLQLFYGDFYGDEIMAANMAMKNKIPQIHFIAIGGSAMHNLAIALHLKGYKVSGSDDEIFDPARGRLAKYGLLPAKEGWSAERITSDLEAVIVGMHARADNPELLRAVELGLRVFSYPEYLYEQSRLKKRVVIGGSHGKTTVTAMILHVLQGVGMDCDYMVGAQLAGFEVMVRLSGAPVIILEGDEYLTSPIDRRPKFHLYRPNIAVINGIAWDHINVFPTFENYVEQFAIFASLVEPKGSLVYYEGDAEVVKIAAQVAEARKDISLYPYNSDAPEGVALQVFGRHNMQNLNAAWNVCRLLGVSDSDFLRHVATFKGASRRLELIAASEGKGGSNGGGGGGTAVYKDFAHSPSKLSATIEAMKEQYPSRYLVAAMELHTFSSLSEEFLSHYRGCMDKADIAIVYFNPHAVEHKKLPPITREMIYNAFGREDLQVYDNSEKLVKDLLARSWADSNLLWMTSGNFDGVDERALAADIT